MWERDLIENLSFFRKSILLILNIKKHYDKCSIIILKNKMDYQQKEPRKS